MNFCAYRKTSISFVPKTISVLAGLLRDTSPQVVKRVIQACAAVYRNLLQWMCTLGDISEETETAWNTFSIMKVNNILLRQYYIKIVALTKLPFVVSGGNFRHD